MAIGTNPEMLAAGYYDTPSFLRTDYKNSIKEFKPIQFASGDKSMLSRIGNSKVTAPALMVTSSLTHLLPGSNRKMANPAVEAFLQGMEKTGEYAGYGSTASFVASAIPGVQPVTLPLSAGLATISALSTGAANVARHFYGEEPIKVPIDENGNIVNTNPSSSLHGESGDGVVSIPSGLSSDNEMSFQDIFDNLAQNKINYETPVSPDVLNKAIRNNVFSSIGEMMSQNTSGGIRGDVVFNDSYNKQLNAMLNIRNTLNNTDVGSDQYRLAGIASNAMMYGQETLAGIDSNFNKDLARVNSIMKTYSTQKDISQELFKYDKMLEDKKTKRSLAIEKAEEQISKDNTDLKEKGKPGLSDKEMDDRRLNAGKSFDKDIADLTNYIKYLQASSTDRRVGSSTTISAKGKAIVDMWNSLPSKGVDITDDHIEYIASKAGLGNAQKKAVEATILAESGGRSSSINESDGDSASVGIIQWNDSRATGLIKSAKEQNANPKDAWFQAKHLANDLKNPSSWSSIEAMNRFFNTKDQREANKLITENYIRPADSTSRVQILEHYQTKL